MVWSLLLSLLVLLIADGVSASVYSCEEVRYKLLNSSFTQKSNYVCVVTQQGFSNWDQLEKVYAQVGTRYTSLHDIATSQSSCAENDQASAPWHFGADSEVELDCAKEFTVIITSEMPDFITPRIEEARYLLKGTRVLVVPRAGMWVHTRRCVGDGEITVFTGAGRGEEEERFVMQSWTCSSLPAWIFSFDSVLTIAIEASVELTMECSSQLVSMEMATPGDRIAILSSGRSDDLMNVQGSNSAVTVVIGEWELHDVTFDMNLTFDPSNTGSIVIQKEWEGAEFNYYNGAHSETLTTNFFEVRYAPNRKQPSEIGKSQDNFVIVIAIDSKAPSPTPSPSQSYCPCSIDSAGSPLDWKYSDIWLDVVVVIDTSEAMGEKALAEAASLTESLLRQGGDDLLSTAPTSNFYTRIGVIAMGETAEVLYNLNMTSADSVKVTTTKGLAEIIIFNAFQDAVLMLLEGAKGRPDRSATRQVIFFMTDSDQMFMAKAIDEFKASQVIIVNNFVQPGEIERTGLKYLASNGFFFSTKIDYTVALQSFCKANCFCKSGMTSYGGSDPATQSSGGCFLSFPDARITFSKAQASCSAQGGIIAVDHDEQKGEFLHQIMSGSTSSYFWLGYTRSDDGVWRWEDQSTSSYTNWRSGEPSANTAVANCAYIYKSEPNLPWGAGNCQLGFPYACEYAPCSVGQKKC